MFLKNMPDREWVDCFLNKTILLWLIECVKILKDQELRFPPEVVNDFLDKLRDTLKNVPRGNIMIIMKLILR